MKRIDYSQIYSDARCDLMRSGRAPHGYNDIVRVAHDVFGAEDLTHRKAQKYGQESASTFNGVVAAILAQAVLGKPAVLHEMAEAAGFALVEREATPAAQGDSLIQTAIDANVALSHLLSEASKAIADGVITEDECKGLRKLLRLLFSDLGKIDNLTVPHKVEVA